MSDSADPLDLAGIEAHPRVPRVAVGQPVIATAPSINRALDERDALLAEVERLRAQVADAWDSGYRNGYSIGYRDDPTALTNYQNPYRTQPEELASETLDQG